MTEKIFTVYGKEIVQDDECWAVAYSEYNADVIATALNELSEEKEYYQIKSGKCEEELLQLRRDNEQLKQQLKEYKQPNCKKCIEYSQDGVGDYCMSENGLLGNAWKMFPCEWDYCNAKNCKEYEE